MMTLWILFCRMTEQWDTLFTVYARDRDDAERQAEGIVQASGYKWLDLKVYPGGFVMHHAHIPGTIQMSKE